MISDLLQKEAEQLKKQSLFRQPPANSMPHGLNFASNDYLSLTNEPETREAYIRGFEGYPAGSGAAMGAGGCHPIHLELEETIASALRVDSALLFSCGFSANLGIIGLLSKLSQHLLIDKSVHASVYDGLRMHQADFSRYRHNDVSHFEQKMCSSSASVVLTEGIFGMSGQQPDLQAMSHICRSSGAVMIVDEAHSFGITGDRGLGRVVHCGLGQEEVPLRLFTFSKALGGQGAVVAGSKDWIEGLHQYARSHIYSTVISPALTYGLLHNFYRLMEMDDRRAVLNKTIEYFQQSILNHSCTWSPSNTPIQKMTLGCPELALNFASELNEKGVFCLATRPPTVIKKESGIRVVLNYRHQAQDIDYLLQCMTEIYEHLCG